MESTGIVLIGHLSYTYKETRGKRRKQGDGYLGCDEMVVVVVVEAQDGRKDWW